jgi:hypothetical protein
MPFALLSCAVAVALHSPIQRSSSDTLITARGDTSIVAGDTLTLIKGAKTPDDSRARVRYLIGPQSVELIDGGRKIPVPAGLAKHLRDLAEEIRYLRRVR